MEGLRLENFWENYFLFEKSSEKLFWKEKGKKNIIQVFWWRMNSLGSIFSNLTILKIELRINIKEKAWINLFFIFLPKMQSHVHGPGCGCKEYISGEEGFN